ncbi:MAG: hypothetical protein M1833_001643 [Piccolia ochrophora]|nr:MAG: hypothetical protein M1833_001643 [Piccolia ochrophora]
MQSMLLTILAFTVTTLYAFPSGLTDSHKTSLLADPEGQDPVLRDASSIFHPFQDDEASPIVHQHLVTYEGDEPRRYKKPVVYNGGVIYKGNQSIIYEAPVTILNYAETIYAASGDISYESSVTYLGGYGTIVYAGPGEVVYKDSVLYFQSVRTFQDPVVLYHGSVTYFGSPTCTCASTDSPRDCLPESEHLKCAASEIHLPSKIFVLGSFNHRGSASYIFEKGGTYLGNVKYSGPGEIVYGGDVLYLGEVTLDDAPVEYWGNVTYVEPKLCTCDTSEGDGPYDCKPGSDKLLCLGDKGFDDQQAQELLAKVKSGKEQARLGPSLDQAEL